MSRSSGSKSSGTKSPKGRSIPELIKIIEANLFGRIASSCKPIVIKSAQDDCNLLSEIFGFAKRILSKEEKMRLIEEIIVKRKFFERVSPVAHIPKILVALINDAARESDLVLFILSHTQNLHTFVNKIGRVRDKKLQSAVVTLQRGFRGKRNKRLQEHLKNNSLLREFILNPIVAQARKDRMIGIFRLLNISKKGKEQLFRFALNPIDGIVFGTKTGMSSKIFRKDSENQEIKVLISHSDITADDALNTVIDEFISNERLDGGSVGVSRLTFIQKKNLSIIKDLVKLGAAVSSSKFDSVKDEQVRKLLRKGAAIKAATKGIITATQRGQTSIRKEILIKTLANTPVIATSNRIIFPGGPKFRDIRKTKRFQTLLTDKRAIKNICRVVEKAEKKELLKLLIVSGIAPKVTGSAQRAFEALSKKEMCKLLTDLLTFERSSPITSRRKVRSTGDKRTRKTTTKKRTSKKTTTKKTSTKRKTA